MRPGVFFTIPALSLSLSLSLSPLSLSFFFVCEYLASPRTNDLHHSMLIVKITVGLVNALA